MKQIKPACDIRSCFLCARCLPEWRVSISQHKQNKKFKKGAAIFSEGNLVEGIYFVYSGKVKIHKKWGEEKELIIKFSKKGDIVGYRGLGNEMVYPISATALEETVVCFIDIPFLESSLKVNHKLVYEMMKFYASELQEAEKRMNNLVHMDVKGRVADTLLMLRKIFGTNRQGFIDITLTKQDMASYAGTTYETFSRVASEFVKEKIIKIDGKNISIVKEKKLQLLTLTAK